MHLTINAITASECGSNSRLSLTKSIIALKNDINSICAYQTISLKTCHHFTIMTAAPQKIKP